MSAFADSSALVKLYADEQGDGEVRGLEAVAVSAIARVEVPAAIWRKHRIGELGEEDARLLVRAFELDFHGSGSEPPRFAAVALIASVLEDAAALAVVHALRGYDAVQLACALAARRADPECGVIACFDEALRRAAAQRGFALVPAMQ